MATEPGATEAHESVEAHHEDSPETLRRRQFLNRLSIGLSGVIGVIIGIPFISFLLAPLLRKPEEAWRPAGPVAQFQVGQTVKVEVDDPSPLPWAGVVSRTAVWLRRDSDTEFLAFAVNCTHLGCPVRWLPDASLFMCPCHGGVFNQDGTVAGGPPPRPLPQYEVRVNGGQVEILAGVSPLAGHE
jgi:menaquinol-cytochrome c reductase iron-sulfur subunit